MRNRTMQKILCPRIRSDTCYADIKCEEGCIVIITLQHVAKKAFQGGDELGDEVSDIDIYTFVFNM